MLSRKQKEGLVDAVRSKFDRAEGVFLTNFAGLRVGSMNELRARLRGEGGEYQVVKNTLLGRAFEGSAVAGLWEHVEGPIGVTFSYGDPVALAKSLVDFARTNPGLVMRAGWIEGRVLERNEIESIAKLPTRQVLLSQLVGAIGAPLQKLHGALQALPNKLIYGLHALKEKREKEAGG